MSKQYSEYEKSRIYEDVWHKGESKTPIYVVLIEGKFRGHYYGILVNLEHCEKKSIKEYKLSEWKQSEIEEDMERRANFLAVSPRPMPNMEKEVIERPSGERVYRERRISKEDEVHTSEGGKLQ